MKFNTIVCFTALTLFLGCYAVGTGSYSQTHPESEKIVSKGEFRLKLSKMKSPPLIMPPARYILESANGDEKWTMVYEWKQDDPWSLERFQLVVLSEKIGYFFGAVKFFVTIDGGKSWKAFEFYERSKQDNVAPHLEGIPKVRLDQTGMGSIFIQSGNDDRAPIRPIYHTKDFGQTWILSNPT